MSQRISEVEFRERFNRNLERSYGISVNNATEKQIYDALSITVKNALLEKRKAFNHNAKEQKAKKIYYLCMEFLLGRSLKTNLCNLGIEDEVKDIINSYGFDMEKIYDNEPDAGLGNGGLGRLAACYMDSLASLNYPAMGFSLRYEYGLFKQVIVDGWQTEMPDVWLPGGEVWLTPRPDKNCTVSFGGHIAQSQKADGTYEYNQVDAKEVEAMAYDLMISGGDSDGVSVLRLWRARNIHKFNMGSFSQGDYMRATMENQEAELISKVLYPSDDHYEGKSLRLKQQYFLVSASINSIFIDVLKNAKDVREFADYAFLHINDTHPALLIPELMRVFMDVHGLGWDEAWDIVVKSTGYTNHTVLAEALECWPMDLFKDLLPRIWQIVCEIDHRYRESSKVKGLSEDVINRTAVIDYGAVKMANLSCIASKKVNGVSQLHSDILVDTIFNDYYKQTPDKFINITNGIAHRRWLSYSNRPLDGLLCDLIGDGFRHAPQELKNLEKFAGDKVVLDKLADIKHQNKVAFANYIKDHQGIIINPNSRFDVQVKRLHEYKRQLLNALKIVGLFNYLKKNPDADITPQTFIFGAKAAPSYYTAKEFIKLICYIQKEIEKYPKIKEKLNVVFLENYCVTLAEHLMPASEVSEQISTAGKEASGTGNMKFMINGALTLGTMDGANVEIAEAVGDDNIFIFGMNTKEVNDLWKIGYNSADYYTKSTALRGIFETLNEGLGGQSFANITQYLIGGNYADPYMCLADFDSYINVASHLEETYKDKYKWNQMSLMNIANAGRFAADRAIEQYAEEIWGLTKIK